MILGWSGKLFVRSLMIPSAIVVYASGTPVRADDFALAVSPPRFELSAEPGQTARAVVELTNSSNVATELNFSTAEWDLSSDGGVITSKGLKPDSCRPWVAIERLQTTLQAKSQLRFRFEVTPPPDTPPTECRFAILIAGSDEHVSPSADTSFPVAAQIALIVYVEVGDVKPQISIVDADVAELNGVLTPVLMVKNSGTAHGRLSAFLNGTDANGKKREFSASSLPILPGETRMIALSVDDGGDAVATRSSSAPVETDSEPIAFPLKMRGKFSDTVNSFDFDGVFEP